METKSEWTARLMKEIQREFEIKVAEQIFEDFEKESFKVEILEERRIAELKFQRIKKKWTS